MLSVAEFVENEEQAALLRELGCDVFQGYLYSKSLLPSDCLQFIQKRNGGNVRKVGLKQRVSRGDILRADPTWGGQSGSPLATPLGGGRNLSSFS